MPNAKRCLSFGAPSNSSSGVALSAAMNDPRRNPFFAPIATFEDDFPDETMNATMTGENNGGLDANRALTPTSFQHTLCLNATSDVDVSLTDEEMSSSPSGGFLSSSSAMARGRRAVAPACSRKQSIVAVLPPTLAGGAVGGENFCGNAPRRATFSAAAGGACVCSAAGVKPLFSKSQLKSAVRNEAASAGESKNGVNAETSVTAEQTKKFSLGDPGANFDRIANISFPSKKTPITDEYKITHEIIGVGESGRVMACFSRNNNEKYALKVLRDGPRSRREVFLHYLTNKHTNIVSIIDIFENTFEGVKCLLIVVEFLEGGDLLTRFENQGRFPYSEKEVARIISQIASAVQYLHGMNIAHRDIKLENILCSSSDSNNCIYKLGDFGFAKRSDRNKLMESPCCTPTYVCPEILSHERYDKSCDMWALGVVMYILLCGYPPFYSMKGLPFSPGMRDRITVGLYAFPPDDWDHISEDAKNVIRNCLRTDPATRSTVDEVMSSDFVRFKGKSPVLQLVGGLKTIWSDSSLSSLDDYKSTKSASDSPAPFSSGGELESADESTDSALGNESSSHCCEDRFSATTKNKIRNEKAKCSECEAGESTTDDDDSEGFFTACAFTFSTPKFGAHKQLASLKICSDGQHNSLRGAAPSQYLRTYRSCRNPTNRNPASTPSKLKMAAAVAPPQLPHHSMSTRFLTQLETNRLAPMSMKSARLYSIQEEVNRALDMIRLGADDIMLSLPQNAVGNRLLERRRKSATTTSGV